MGRGEEQAAQLRPSVKLTVACSPRLGPDRSVEVARRLSLLGHSVAVNLAARMVRDSAHLDRLLAAMAQAGVDDVLLIGGDATPPHGPYHSAADLLPIVHEHPQRPTEIGIAGYPEGHPLIDSRTLTDILERKSALATYITTQLCFDAEALLTWLSETRERGVALPVRVGLPGVVDRRRLLEISMRIGVGPSLGFLRSSAAYGASWAARGSRPTAYTTPSCLASRIALGSTSQGSTTTRSISSWTPGSGSARSVTLSYLSRPLRHESARFPCPAADCGGWLTGCCDHRQDAPIPFGRIAEASSKPSGVSLSHECETSESRRTVELCPLRACAQGHSRRPLLKQRSISDSAPRRVSAAAQIVHGGCRPAGVRRARRLPRPRPACRTAARRRRSLNARGGRRRPTEPGSSR